MNPTSFSPRPFAGEGPGVRGQSLNYAKLSKSPPLVQDRLMGQSSDMDLCHSPAVDELV